MKNRVSGSLFTVGITVPLLVGGCSTANTIVGQTSSANMVSSWSARAASDVTNLTRQATPNGSATPRSQEHGNQVLHDVDYTRTQVTQIQTVAQLQGIRVPYIPRKIRADNGASRRLQTTGDHHVLSLQFPAITVLNATYFDDIRSYLEPPGQILKLLPEGDTHLVNGTPAQWWKLPYTKGNTLEMLTLQPQGKTWVALLPTASEPTNKPAIQAVAETLNALT